MRTLAEQNARVVAAYEKVVDAELTLNAARRDFAWQLDNQRRIQEMAAFQGDFLVRSRPGGAFIEEAQTVARHER